MLLFNNILYKHMRLTSKVNLTKRFSEKYKRMRLITRLYGIVLVDNPSFSTVKINKLSFDKQKVTASVILCHLFISPSYFYTFFKALVIVGC